MKFASAIACPIEIPRQARGAPSGLDGMSLTASRGDSKNQCADKHFSTAEGRRVRERQLALSCPPRSLVPMAQLPSQQTLGTRGDLRQNAVRVIAVDHSIASARTRRLVADSLRKSRRDLAVDLRSPPLFASEASVCDSDRYPEGRDTRVGWLGEERSNE